MADDYNGTPGNATRKPSINIVSTTGATPIEVTVAAAHGLKEGDRVEISGHAVNVEANGLWYVHEKTATTFEIYAGWTSSAVSSPVAGSGAGAATGTITPLGLLPRMPRADDATELTDMSMLNAGLEDAKDGQAWLAERVGSYRLAGILDVTAAAASPGAGVAAAFTTTSATWKVDTSIEGAWAVKPVVAVQLDDYVEIELTGTAVLSGVLNVALGIGFVFIEHGVSYSSAGAVIQSGCQQIESSHSAIPFNLKARGKLSTFLAGITHGVKLYPVLMAYGLAGTPSYQLVGDVSMTIKVWRPN